MKKILIFIPFFCIILNSCASQIYEDYYGGRRLTDDELSSIEALLDETSAPAYAEVTDSSGVQIVFWTEGGSVYHQSEKCPSLSKSRSILSGSVDAAGLSGKAGSCSKCFQ